ncbi:MAG TPA: rhomboid family intramembrane serine protease [Opitutus sp.]|nr:rhomboid family intramembrane serine protease [Opitutus sp.]
MLSDRSYMRDDYPRQGTNVLTWLISAIVGVWVLEFVFLRLLNGDPSLANLLTLTAYNVKSGKIWTLFTYSFLHSTGNLLHIVANLLGLYFLGRVLQPMLGGRRFFWVYAMAVVAGGLLWLATHWNDRGSAIGASAGVAGLFIVFACFYPNQPMTFLLFFILPVTLKPKYVALAWLAIELLGFVFYEVMGASSPFGGSIAHSAHLGGMLAGWIYYRYLHEASWSLGSARPDIELPRWLRRSAKSAPPAAFHVDLSRREDLRAEVDRILDKINSEGFAALTPDEKRLLDDARDLLSRR